MPMLSILAAAALAAPAFVERPCTKPELVQAAARCGTVTVPENRVAARGRRIALNLTILPAQGPATLPPLFDIEGGPGLPVSKNAEFYLTFGAGYRQSRDIVLLDQRGTGGSNGLMCPELSAANDPFAPMFPPEKVVACRASLEPRADLTRYGTAEAVADLEDVRRALRYQQIDLFALSYGTTVALRYLASFPGKVRAAVLMVAVPATAMAPRFHAQAGEQTLRAIFADCAADPACRFAYPDIAGDLAKAVALRQGKSDPPPEIFLEKLRSSAYSTAGARSLPYVIRRAATGDLSPFKAASASPLASLYADGMFLSVTCTESYALMDYNKAAAEARATIFGDYRLRRQRDACKAWPAGKPARDHLRPVRSDAAVLFIAGDRDPVTPPEWAHQAARTLPNARVLTIPFGGHVLDGLSAVDTCFDPLAIRFLTTADAKTLDTSCVATMQPPPFKLP
jgi:pimeloyl-ACP methyl ester carboxylesterase